MKRSPNIFPLSYNRTTMRSSDKSTSNTKSPIKKYFSSSSKKSSSTKNSRSSKLTLSGKRQKNIGEFFSGRFHSVTPAAKTTSKPRKCLFNNESSVKSKIKSKNTSALDETSSSSFTYSSNSQRYIDLDISGQCSKLDLHGCLEVVELVDTQSTPTKLENENESEKENSPKLQKTFSTAKFNNVDIDKDEHVNPKALTKLHTAVVKEVDCYAESLRENFVRPEGFYRFVEGDADERKEKVEYDLDDEDMCWLNLVRNTKFSGIKGLTEDKFEMCLDRLEKMAAHLQLNTLKINSGHHKSKQNNQLDDEDIFCSICLDDECQNSNVILLCDLCNLAVHQECYGVPLIPEGQWLCSWCQWKQSNKSSNKSTSKKSRLNGRCKTEKNRVKFFAGGDEDNNDDEESSVSNDGSCCLCPVKGGALKKTDNGKWAHVLCALWIPEVGFGSVEYLEPITKLGEVPAARHKLTCSICKKKDVGACIQCMRKNCYTAFHIMCAQKIGTYMRIEQGLGGDDDDADSPMNIKKSFLCDVHKPEGARPFLPMYENGDDDDDDESCRGDNEDEVIDDDGHREISPKRKSKRQLLKMTRTSKSQSQLNNKKSTNGPSTTKSKLNSKSGGINKSKSTSALVASTVVLELPNISPNKLKEIAKECLVPSSSSSSSASSSSSSSFSSSSLQEIMAAVYNYWLLKRKSRNNVPLLKTYYTHLMSSHMPSKMGNTDDTKLAYDGLKDAKKLRNEMEKVRLLMELVRKREKLKLLMIKLKEQTLNTRLNPWNAYLSRILDRLQSLDKCDVFAHPVAVDQVPGYKQKIKQPMDFSTMRYKALNYSYENFESFEKDFELMVSNCLLFNSKHTIYHKAAIKMKKQSQHILEEGKAKLQRMPREALPPSTDEDDLEFNGDLDSQKSMDEDVCNGDDPSDDEEDEGVGDGDEDIDIVIDDVNNDDNDTNIHGDKVEENAPVIIDDKVAEEIDEVEVKKDAIVEDTGRDKLNVKSSINDVRNDDDNDVINIDDNNEKDYVCDNTNKHLDFETCDKIKTGLTRLTGWVKRQVRKNITNEDSCNNNNDISSSSSSSTHNVINASDDTENNNKDLGNTGVDKGLNMDSNDLPSCDDVMKADNHDEDILVGDDDSDVACTDNDGQIDNNNNHEKNINNKNVINNTLTENKINENDIKINVDGENNEDDEDDDGVFIIETIELEDRHKAGEGEATENGCRSDESLGTNNNDLFFSEEIIIDNEEDDNDNLDVNEEKQDDDVNKITKSSDDIINKDSNLINNNNDNIDSNVVIENISIEDEEVCVIDNDEGDEDEKKKLTDNRKDEIYNNNDRNSDDGRSDIKPTTTSTIITTTTTTTTMTTTAATTTMTTTAATTTMTTTAATTTMTTTAATTTMTTTAATTTMTTTSNTNNKTIEREDNEDDLNDDDDDEYNRMMTFKSKIVESDSFNSGSTSISGLERSTNRVDLTKQTVINLMTLLLNAVKNSTEVEIQNNVKIEIKNENLTIEGNKIENVVGLNFNISPTFQTFNKLMMLCSHKDEETDDGDDDEEEERSKTRKCHNIKHSTKKQQSPFSKMPPSSSSSSQKNRKNKLKPSKSFDLSLEKPKCTHSQVSLSSSYSKAVNSTKCGKVDGESRRTSERTKTPTHRYLIDDDLFFQSLTSPLKRKRKHSQVLNDATTSPTTTTKLTPTTNHSNSNDADGLNMNSDEPPVLSRCPSPLNVSYDDDEDDDDDVLAYNQVDKSYSKNKKCWASKKSPTTKSKHHQPIRKKMKYYVDSSPPRLVKNVSDSPRHAPVSVRKLLKSSLLKNNKNAQIFKKNIQSTNKNTENKTLYKRINRKRYLGMKKKLKKEEEVSGHKKCTSDIIREIDINDDDDDVNENVTKNNLVPSTSCSSLPELLNNTPQSSSSSSSSSLAPSSPPLSSSPHLNHNQGNDDDSGKSPSIENQDSEMPELITEIISDINDGCHDDGGAGKIEDIECSDALDAAAVGISGGSDEAPIPAMQDDKLDNKLDNISGDIANDCTYNVVEDVKVNNDNNNDYDDNNGDISQHHDHEHDTVNDYDDDDDIMIDCEEVEISTEDDEDNEDGGGDGNDDNDKTCDEMAADDHDKVRVSSKRTHDDDDDVDDGNVNDLPIKKKMKIEDGHGHVDETMSNDVLVVQSSTSFVPTSFSSMMTKLSSMPLSSSALLSSTSSTSSVSSLSSLCNLLINKDETRMQSVISSTSSTITTSTSSSTSLSSSSTTTPSSIPITTMLSPPPSSSITTISSNSTSLSFSLSSPSSLSVIKPCIIASPFKKTASYITAILSPSSTSSAAAAATLSAAVASSLATTSSCSPSSPLKMVCFFNAQPIHPALKHVLISPRSKTLASTPTTPTTMPTFIQLNAATASTLIKLSTVTSSSSSLSTTTTSSSLMTSSKMTSLITSSSTTTTASLSLSTTTSSSTITTSSSSTITTSSSIKTLLSTAITSSSATITSSSTTITSSTTTTSITSTITSPKILTTQPVEFILKSAKVIIEKLHHLKSPPSLSLSSPQSLSSSPSLSSPSSVTNDAMLTIDEDINS